MTHDLRQTDGAPEVSTHPPEVTLVAGYQSGALARCTEMHAQHYARIAGFGRAFEARIAAGLADFADRLDHPCIGLWLAVRRGQIVGTVAIDGEDIGGIAPANFARLPQRSRIQMVFQDPTDSLNPRFTAVRAIADPIMQLGDIRGRDALRTRCEELATMVGLPHNLLDRFPHQLSGGQKARVGIARAIALHPKLVILDEPTAALDVSVQAVVLNLLQDLKARLGMSYLFVSHDLNVVRLLCDRVIVMRTGRIVEEGSSEKVLSDPQDDYTKELLTAIPHPPLQVH